MNVSSPKIDVTLDEVKATWVGRFKVWVHYRVLRTWVFPALPEPYRMQFYKASRRWLYGPNANNEDLIALLQQAIRQVSADQGV